MLNEAVGAIRRPFSLPRRPLRETEAGAAALSTKKDNR
jgi:hypothetical protein